MYMVSVTIASPAAGYSMATQFDSSISPTQAAMAFVPGMHGHRVGHFQTSKDLDGVIVPIPRVKTHDDLAGCPGPAETGHELFDEVLGPALGVGRSLAHPGVEDLAGVGPPGEDRVVARDLGVAIGRATFEPSEHLTDRRVDVDH